MQLPALLFLYLVVTFYLTLVLTMQRAPWAAQWELRHMHMHMHMRHGHMGLRAR